jgi:hypothetical protein
LDGGPLPFRFGQPSSRPRSQKQNCFLNTTTAHCFLSLKSKIRTEWRVIKEIKTKSAEAPMRPVSRLCAWRHRSVKHHSDLDKVLSPMCVAMFRFPVCDNPETWLIVLCWFYASRTGRSVRHGARS